MEYASLAYGRWMHLQLHLIQYNTTASDTI